MKTPREAALSRLSASPISPAFDPGPTRSPIPRGGQVHKVPPRRFPPPEGGNPEAPVSFFPTRLFERPNTILVHGPSRPSINLALYAFAEAITPDFQWVDIGVPGEEAVSSDPAQLGWIPEERMWRVDRPEKLRPNELTANLALFGLIRWDEPASTIAQVTEFLRLPETSQRILSTRPRDGRPGVLAVTNAHRVMALYPEERVGPVLAVHQNAGFSVLVGFAEVAGPAQKLFDFVFQLDCGSPSAWRTGHLVCTKGISSGPLRDARPVSLEEIPLLASVFSRANAFP